MSTPSLTVLLAVALLMLVGCLVGLHRLVCCGLGWHRWRRDHARLLWRCSDCHEEITQEQLEAMEITS